MKTLIIDNYDSFTFNLYQYVGELGGNPIVYRNDQITLEDVMKGNYSHIIISPGPGSPDDPAFFGICNHVILTIGKTIPLLGVCLGHQGIISAFGGKIVRATTIKHGKTSIITHNEKDLFSQISNPLVGMRYHSLIGERSRLPDDLEVTAETVEDKVIMGVRHKKYQIFGVQFHPESIGTQEGKKILKNFLSIEVRPRTRSDLAKKQI